MFKLYLKKFDPATEAGTAAGEGGEGGEKVQGEEKHNTGHNTSPFDTMWNPPAKDETAAQAQTQQQPATTPAAATSVDDYIQELNLVGTLDQEQVGLALRGDVKAFTDVLSAVQANMYKKMLGDTNRLVNARLEQQTASIQESSGQQINMALAQQTLAKELPFTQQPAFKPVADHVFNKLLETHSLSDAISKTKSYFEDMSKAQGGTVNSANAGHGSSMQNNSSAPEEDWVAMLTGKS